MSGAATPVTAELLRTMPLPRHREGEDKDQRGRVLVIGGSVEVPGGALLAGVAALRAGAGKLQIATCRSTAPQLAVAVPEARVLRLEETPPGGISPAEAPRLAEAADRCDAVLIGPGMMDGEAAAALTAGVLERAEPARGGFVLDAMALHRLGACREVLRNHAGRIVLTPHAGEMAALLGIGRDTVLGDPLAAARQAAAALQAIVAMKGGCTFVVTPQGRAWLYDGGNVGLATSGSGDTLAGVIAGLLARGASPVEAAIWGVYLHGEAGVRLARKRGPVGFLARELLAEIPAIMAATACG
ncbi:NAD(P)H-hydrate dehydratase [Siccirubricoccus sp. KC 17139]|uniref:ADP-dependent (S)-NAD(P)H-hydrate dehydratase n=1 Tax=Siccirubricoccus soli TaxID=2899147 RepID=A0ABT1DC64_9PROT|nr:NAD(P)H-hydrate dehydratase [Siccirubricoccus soli]MCO6419494.1 NAD(P)H-hydrate dehydratase [Siccirubricoccus soli]MCP2685629.1 NAD(P)H-hydrate dehydratase [Siccirubricoccus soli]